MDRPTLQDKLDRARDHFHAGEFEAAVQIYEDVLADLPGSAPVLLALATTESSMGRLDAAARHFQEVLEGDPQSIPAIRGLLGIAEASGTAHKALRLAIRAIRIDPADETNWVHLAVMLGQSHDFSAVPTKELEAILLACLDHPAVGLRQIGGALMALFRATPGLGELLELDDAAAVEERLANPAAFAAFTSPALLRAMELTVLPSLSTERVLQAARRVLVLVAQRGEEDHPGLRNLHFMTALAQQCYLTGYIHGYADDEQAAVEEMILGMAGRPLGEDPLDAARVVLLACYLPLIQWERAEDVLHLANDLQSPELASLAKQQILDPVREAELKEAIPVLSTIEDETSAKVQEMYETHPYPQWTRTHHVPARPLIEHLQAKLPGTSFPELEGIEAPLVLIAGCGTGVHAIDTHTSIEGARVIGLDLSLSSLAYAARKATELELENIGFVQGDILAVAEWDETFDVIEAGGVLHHMNDPVAGWRALLSRLRPGGVMMIGLYSELARKGIVAVREELAETLAVDQDEDIRDVRQRVIAFLETHPSGASLLRWRDFYSLQEFRDLVLHPQEHRFTIPRLQGIMDQLGVEFLGFSPVPSGALAPFRASFPEDDALTDLDHWHAFEEDNPGLFSGMYKFWVRKPA